MLAESASLPTDDERYAFEFKWDGMRAIAHCEDGSLRLENRNYDDVTSQFPELLPLGKEFEGRQAILDGEIVVINEDTGAPDFGLLQPRLALARERAELRSQFDRAVRYLIFDMVFLDQHSLLNEPYVERRRMLEELELSGAAWDSPRYHIGNGQTVLRTSQTRGLEGVLAKRLDSGYYPGERTTAWLKVHNLIREEFVIGGWTPGEGARAGTVGSLLLGYHAHDAAGATRLRFAGRVGTGFDPFTLSLLARELRGIVHSKSPFHVGETENGPVRYVIPQLVADVEFLGWTREGRVRQARFKGLRKDRRAKDILFGPEIAREVVGIA